jgi:ankyrin repeat protein
MKCSHASLAGLIVVGALLIAAAPGCSSDPSAKAKKEAEFVQAVCMGDTDKVKQLLAAGADVNAKDRDGRAPLYQACRVMMGQRSIEMLLAAGADVDARDKAGKTPLYAAAESGAGQDVIKQLLAHNASPNMADNEGYTSLHAACMGNGQPEIIRLLVGGGAKVDAKDHEGWTPLHHAAQRGRVEAVSVLLELKADRDPRP